MNNKPKTITASTKKHFFLVTGELIFATHQGNEETLQINTARLNAVVNSDTENATAPLIGKAQQALQLQFHEKNQDLNVKMIDVVILNFTHLGHMTPEEFTGPSVQA